MYIILMGFVFIIRWLFGFCILAYHKVVNREGY